MCKERERERVDSSQKRKQSANSPQRGTRALLAPPNVPYLSENGAGALERCFLQTRPTEQMPRGNAQTRPTEQMPNASLSAICRHRQACVGYLLCSLGRHARVSGVSARYHHVKHPRGSLSLRLRASRKHDTGGNESARPNMEWPALAARRRELYNPSNHIHVSACDRLTYMYRRACIKRTYVRA